MTSYHACSVVAVIALVALNVKAAEAQLMSTCTENSPERRGELGCSIVESKLLPADLKEPLFWHIDRFDSLERARAAVSLASVAFEAAGAAWLMTIEGRPAEHHGGRHVTQVGPLPLPRASRVLNGGSISRLCAGHVFSGTSSFRCRSCLRAGRRGVLRDSGSRLHSPGRADAGASSRSGDARCRHGFDASPCAGGDRPRRVATGHHADGRSRSAAAR